MSYQKLIFQFIIYKTETIEISQVQIPNKTNKWKKKKIIFSAID